MGHVICYSNCDTFENGRGLLVVIHYTREKVPQEHRGALIKKGGTSGPGQWARRLTGRCAYHNSNRTERPHGGTEPGLQEADYRGLCRFCVVS